jgi:hypothetical protein
MVHAEIVFHYLLQTIFTSADDRLIRRYLLLLVSPAQPSRHVDREAVATIWASRRRVGDRGLAKKSVPTQLWRVRD